MSCVFKLLSCLSHGQASVERGFSVNSNLLVENMPEDSLTAQRIVQDHVKSLKPEVYEVKVTKIVLIMLTMFFFLTVLELSYF